MVMEGRNMSIRWPLGLETMNSRLTVIVSLRSASFRSLLPSTSFSSFTSSALDTESSASFFHDGSKSLGRLIGIRPGTGGKLHFPGSGKYEQSEIGSITGKLPRRRRLGRASKRICIPLLVNIMVRLNRKKNKSKSG